MRTIVVEFDKNPLREWDMRRVLRAPNAVDKAAAPAWTHTASRVKPRDTSFLWGVRVEVPDAVDGREVVDFITHRVCAPLTRFRWWDSAAAVKA